MSLGTEYAVGGERGGGKNRTKRTSGTPKWSSVMVKLLKKRKAETGIAGDVAERLKVLAYAIGPQLVDSL